MMTMSFVTIAKTMTLHDEYRETNVFRYYLVRMSSPIALMTLTDVPIRRHRVHRHDSESEDKNEGIVKSTYIIIAE